MNDPHENLPDDVLESLLQPLRDATPPIEARTANRNAVRHTLAKNVGPAWWQRTIAVPVPIAIAASIILLLATAAVMRPSSPGASVAPSETPAPRWTIERSFIRTLTSSTTSDFVTANVWEKRDDS